MAEETTGRAGAVADLGASLAGKYLTFQIGDEEYGLAILKVREIIGLLDITVVPRTPSFVRGVINLRGKVIPVVDLRAKFGMAQVPDTDQTCIIVVDADAGDRVVQMGVLVDQVSEVRDIDAGSIEPPPAFGLAIDTSFILGMGKVSERVLMLLDVDKVLSVNELAAVDSVASDF